MTSSPGRNSAHAASSATWWLPSPIFSPQIHSSTAAMNTTASRFSRGPKVSSAPSSSMPSPPLSGSVSSSQPASSSVTQIGTPMAIHAPKVMVMPHMLSR